MSNWHQGMKSGITALDPGEISEYLYYAYSGVYLSLTSRYPLGTNVFERDWDVLVVLDACRVDALHEVAPEYDFLDGIGQIWSVGSTSFEWYAKTFTRPYRDILSSTALISANPFAERTLVHGERPPDHAVPVEFPAWRTVSADALDHLEITRNHDRPFADISDKAPHSTTAQDPSYVTDRAIIAGRGPSERAVIHYFQPHRPFIQNLVRNGTKMTDVEDKPYEAGRRGQAEREDLWPLYLDNLRLVLDSVETLLQNVDGTVALTADHGELFGELGQFGHFQSIPHPDLKRVPWVEMTATDERTRDPDEEFTETGSRDIEQQLEELGYL